MTNSYFATAFVSAHSVGVTIRAESIGTAFKLAEDYLQERNPQSEVIVQAVQRINNEFTDGSNVSSQVFQARPSGPLAAISLSLF
jgi:hypothetical protein